MKKYICTLLFVLLLGFFGNAQSVIEANLQEVMKQRGNEMISINIILKSQMEAAELRDMATRAVDVAGKKELIIKELKEYSNKEQAEILSILESEKRSNKVSDISCHWLVNSINCTASHDVIYRLAEHPSVSMIGYNESVNVIGNIKAEKVEATRGAASHVTQVNADKVWNAGYTGKGIVVAVIDTGTNFDHTDIDSDNLWDGGASYPYHGYNVIDPVFAPYDDNGHGSHCAGIVCGNGKSGSQTGIAPDATLMTVKVADKDGVTTLEYLTTGIEFAVENGANVMNISIGWQDPSLSVSTTFREILTNTLELGILASVAAGNDKDEIIFFPVPKNINAPGNCPPAWLHPDQEANPGGLSGIISVGAIDNSNSPGNFSSQGPVTWQDSKWGDYPYNPGIGLIRPDICAPGVEVLSLSHNKNDGYLKLSGTSMAAPCVAGVIALMLEKDPSLTPSDLCRLIETTAIKLSDTKNNTTGSGCIDALAAVYGGKKIPYLNFISCSPEVTLAGNNKDLTVRLINNGEAATTSITNVTLSTDDDYVTIVNNTATFDMMTPKESASGMFKININNNAPIGHTIVFNLEATYNDGEEDLHFYDSFLMEINELPYIRYKSCSPNMLTSSDVSEIAISMYNNGNVATTDNATVTLSSTDFYMNVIDDEAIYGPMEPNASKEGTFRLAVSPITPEDHIFNMKIKTTLANHYAKQNIKYEFDDLSTCGWTSIDADGDGYQWFSSGTLVSEGCGYQGSKYCLFSQSYTNHYGGVVLYPDNYLVSPMKIFVEDDTEFSFWACAHDANYPAEHFGVAISTTGNTKASDFTTIAEWTMTAKSGQTANNAERGKTREQGQWYNYSADLSSYVGQEIWIAIRHFNCYDKYILAVDDIEIRNVNMPVSWEENFTLTFKSLTPKIELDSYTPETLFNNNNSIDITMTNNGLADMTSNINVILSTNSQYITIDENVAIYPPINMGEKQTKTFNINVDPSIPNGQIVTFNVNALPEESLTSDIIFNFNDDLNGWTTINANNDDHTWYHSSNQEVHEIIPATSHSGNGHIMSESYCNATYNSMSPDDYIVTPMKIKVTENTSINFWACAQDDAYPDEHFGVAVSTKSNTDDKDFTTIAEWTLTAKAGHSRKTRGDNGEWHQYTANLSEFAGQNIWVAIRHFKSSDLFCICVDDVEIKNFVKVYDWTSSFTMTASNENIVPSNLIATAIDDKSISLIWDSIDDASSYNIYRDNEYLCNVNSTHYTDSELTENTEYCYSVTGVNEEESGHSNTSCASTLSSPPVCSTPTNIQYLVEENVYDIKYYITITWDEIPNADFYNVYINNNLFGPRTVPSFSVGVAEDCEMKFNILTNCGNDGTSELSEDIIVVFGEGQYNDCQAPINLKATVEEYAAGFANAFKITLTWNSVTEANSYNLYVNNNLFKENITSNSYVLGSDTEGSYTFNVTSNCDNGESDMSLSYTVKLEHIGINEYSGNIELYPNPVNSKLYIECQEAIEDVCIFNVTGVMVYHESDLKDNEIDMSDFSEGLYIIKIKTNNYNIVKRFIKK